MRRYVFVLLVAIVSLILLSGIEILLGEEEIAQARSSHAITRSQTVHAVSALPLKLATSTPGVNTHKPQASTHTGPTRSPQTGTPSRQNNRPGILQQLGSDLAALLNNAVLITAFAALITAVGNIVTSLIGVRINRNSLLEIQRNQHAHERMINEARRPGEQQEDKYEQIEANYISSKRGIWENMDEYVQVPVLSTRQPPNGFRMRNPRRESDIFDPFFLIRDAQVQLEQAILAGNPVDLPQEVLHPEASRRPHHYILRGEIGVGKTLELKHIAHEVWKHQSDTNNQNDAKNTKRLPVYIALKDFATSAYRNLFDYIVSDCYESIKNLGPEPITKDDVKSFLHAKLDDGSVLLLLDGLDETFIGHHDKERKDCCDRVSEAINIIANRHNKAFVIVTTRNYIESNKYIEPFMQYHILDFRLADIWSFVEKYLRFKREESDLEHLKGIIRNNIRLQSLVARQLLLRDASKMYLGAPPARRNLASPYQLAQLSHKSMDELFRNWNRDKSSIDDTHRGNVRRKKGIHLSRRSQTIHSSNFSDPVKLHLLGEIAWKFHTKYQHQMSQQEMAGIIRAFIPDKPFNRATIFFSRDLDLPWNKQIRSEEFCRKIQQEISHHSGLLQERNELAAGASYGFPGLPFQEFFAASYAKRHHKRAVLIKNYNHPWWEQVIVFYIHMADATEAEIFLDELLRLRADDFHTNLLLAGRCLAAHKDKEENSLAELYHRITWQLLEALINTKCIKVRNHIIDVLASIETNSENLLRKLFAQRQRFLPVPAQGTAGTPALPTTHVFCDDLFNRLGNARSFSIPYALLPLVVALPYQNFLQDVQTLMTDLAEDGMAAFINEMILTATNHQNHIRLIDALGTLAEPAIATALYERLKVTMQSLAHAPQADTIELACHIVRALAWHADSSLPDKLADSLLLNQPADSSPLDTLAAWVETAIDKRIRCSLVKTLLVWSELFSSKEVVEKMQKMFEKDGLDDHVRWSIAIALTVSDIDIQRNPQLRRSSGWDKFQSQDVKCWSDQLQQKTIDMSWFTSRIPMVSSEDRTYVIDTLGALLKDEQCLKGLAQDQQWQHLTDDLHQARWVVWRRNKCRERS